MLIDILIIGAGLMTLECKMQKFLAAAFSGTLELSNLNSKTFRNSHAPEKVPEAIYQGL